MRSFIKIMTSCFVIAVFVTACGGEIDAGAGSVIDPKIDLNPVGPAGSANKPGKFKITTPNMGCKRGKGERLGCVRFGPGQSGHIIFAINGNAAARTCEEHAARVISKIQISATDENPGEEPSDKGDFEDSSYPLDEKFKTHGFPDIDINTGIVWEAGDDNPAASRVKIENRNSSDVDDPRGVDFWYQVTVEKCSESSNRYWVTDPRGENDGMN